MNVKKIQPRRAVDVTPEIIAAWKEAHGRGIFEMTVNGDDPKDEEQDKIGYFRKPTRTELSASITGQADPLGSAEGLLRDCWLGGDEELLDDEDYFKGALVQFQEINKIRTGAIKKL